jgi:hypothetical protein
MPVQSPEDVDNVVVGVVTVPTNVTVTMVDEIVDAALQDAPWIDRVQYVGEKRAKYVGAHVAYGGLVNVQVEDQTLLLTLDKFLEGYRLYCIQTGEGVWDVYENGDADSGQQILQLALFGEVVYG